MMASVSTLARSSGAPKPFSKVNFSISITLFLLCLGFDLVTDFLHVLAQSSHGVAPGQETCEHAQDQQFSRNPLQRRHPFSTLKASAARRKSARRCPHLPRSPD